MPSDAYLRRTLETDKKMLNLLKWHKKFNSILTKRYGYNWTLKGNGVSLMDDIIQVEHLIKYYGSLPAVDDVSFRVKRGSLFAFLGMNGAGKTTTINILSTLLAMNSGKVIVNGFELGKDDDRIRSSIGVVFQDGVLDDFLTVRENLLTRGSFYNIDPTTLKKRMQEVAEITGCSEFIDRRYGKLSGGQKRRADIARALINQPDILFLDEPTTGLDPKTRVSIWKTVDDMQKQLGMTVFLTTHYMEEAANADFVTIIHKGRIIAEGTPHELKERYSKDVLKIYNPSPELCDYLANRNIEYRSGNSVLIIEMTGAKQVIRFLNEIRDMVDSFEYVLGNMDDVFLKVTGERREDTNV